MLVIIIFLNISQDYDFLREYTKLLIQLDHINKYVIIIYLCFT